MNFSIDYIISSTFNWYEKTLPLLVNSLLKSGIESDRIRIYVGNCKERIPHISNFMGCYIKFIDHNSYDYTSLIEYSVEETDASHFFMLHDTCEVDENFKELVQNFNRDFECNYLVNYYPGICNFGLYRIELCQRHFEFIQGLKDLTKTVAVEVEGFFVKKSISKISYPNEDVQMYDANPYSDNERRCEYYKHIGLKKYKANWGQTWGVWNTSL